MQQTNQVEGEEAVVDLEQTKVETLAEEVREDKAKSKPKEKVLQAEEGDKDEK